MFIEQKLNLILVSSSLILCDFQRESPWNLFTFVWMCLEHMNVLNHLFVRKCCIYLVILPWFVVDIFLVPSSAFFIHEFLLSIAELLYSSLFFIICGFNLSFL